MNAETKLTRRLPSNAKVLKEINGIPIYNLNVFQNIMSRNYNNQNTPALDYFGNIITYGNLPNEVMKYINAFKNIGITENSVVTLSLPVCVENIIALFSLNSMHAIINSVNFLFLKNDMKTYTFDKKSDILIISDIFFPYIIDQIKYSGLNHIILISLNDYLLEEDRDRFLDTSSFPSRIKEAFEQWRMVEPHIDEISKSNNVKISFLRDLIDDNSQASCGLAYDIDNDIERDSVYLYTSGTTGNPKCIVFKEYAPNAIIEMHNGLDLGDYVGDRSLLVAPTSVATGMFFATFLQMAQGKTMVLQPIYDKYTFFDDLVNFHINHVLATASFYITAASRGVMGKDILKDLRRPGSGGEPFTKSNVIKINNWLKENGCREKLFIGGGASEVGSGVLTSYNMNSQTKTNETGKPIPGVFVKIVDEFGKEVKKGKRGVMEVSSAASADRYYENEEATKNYFYYDENGLKWAKLGDIAVQNPDNSYSMLGRGTSSYIDKNNNIRYLFDIEYSLDEDTPILEWEITAFKGSDSIFYVVAQVVLKDDFSLNKSEIVKMICEKYGVDSVKFYPSFGTSETTGKRDHLALKSDMRGYFSPYDDMHLQLINYDTMEKTIVSKAYIDK